MYLGLQTTTAVNAVLLNSSAPLFMLLCSWMIEREAASARQLVGVLISLAGSRERSISSASPPYSPAWSWLRGRRPSANSNAVKGQVSALSEHFFDIDVTKFQRYPNTHGVPLNGLFGRG